MHTDPKIFFIIRSVWFWTIAQLLMTEKATSRIQQDI